MKKIELENNSPLNGVISKMIGNLSISISDKLSDIVYEFAEPPIEGEITKGKLSYRGIKLCTYSECMRTTQWIEQRGVQIGPKIITQGVK